MRKTDRKHVTLKWSQELDTELLLLRSNGLDTEAIAERTGRTANSVRDRLKVLESLNTSGLPESKTARLATPDSRYGSKAIREASDVFAARLPGSAMTE